MNLTNDELSDLAADLTGGDAAYRRPISDVGAWLDDLEHGVRPALRALGELLIGVTDRARAESADKFTARCLGVTDCASLVNEERELDPVSRLTTALALAEWIDEHAAACEIGPGQYSQPPQWSQTEIGGRHYQHPLCLRVHFPCGTLLDDTGCVVSIETRESMMHSAEVSAYVTPQAQTCARAVLDRLADRAAQLNPYRGRAVRATYVHGLRLDVIDLPTTLNRENVIVPAQVWAEVDLGVTAVRDRHEALNAHGLGARRGVLLCGPPGTGKSAVSAVVAREVVGDFTVIYVEARAGAALLTAVVEEAQRLGGPVLLVIEDVDLWCTDRAVGGGGLSELLQAMDIQPEARILTLASTNDAATPGQGGHPHRALRRDRRSRLPEARRCRAYSDGADRRHPRWRGRRHGCGGGRAAGQHQRQRHPRGCSPRGARSGRRRRQHGGTAGRGEQPALPRRSARRDVSVIGCFGRRWSSLEMVLRGAING